MKNKIAFGIALIFFATATSTFAQLKYGIKTGLNISSNSISKISGSNQLLQKESYNGFMIGPTVEATLPFFRLGLDLSILYSQKGIAFQNFGKATVSYLEIPLNLKYKFGIPKLLDLYASAGPYISYGFPGNISGDKLTAVNISRFDIGANIGLGLELLNKAQIGANYGFGFMRNEIETINSASKINYRNGIFSITATIFF